MRDRFGAVLTASLSVLFFEAAIGLIAGYVWGQTQEAPSLPYNAMGLLVMLIAAPFVAAAGAALGALVTVCVIMPLLAAAGWLGRTVSGREAWWWIPAATAAAVAPPVLAVTVSGTGPLTWLGAWLTVTTVLAAPALVARRLLLPDRPPLSGGSMFGWIALYGTLAAVTAFALAGIALYAGIGYEPPQLNREQIAGTYADGKGGTLTLAPDGRATANRVDTFAYDDSVDPFEPQVRACTGDGTWTYDPAEGPYAQQVDVTIDGCAVGMDSWSVYGSLEHPKLYVYIGDPDSWDLYTLRHD
ncbi:hypothetical protein ACWGI1_18095 [Streptomyces sp. NPDC054835]